MPGFLLHVGAKTKCFHGAEAIIAPTQPRVMVSGQPIANITAATPVAGCPFQIPVGAGTKPQPCVIIKWAMPSTRFLVNGQPAGLYVSPGPAPGICQSIEQIPQGAPVVAAAQSRVIGS